MSKHRDSQLVTEKNLNEEIAKVAYDLYKQRGMGHGFDFDDWLKAEKIVLAEQEKLERNEIDLMSAVAVKKASERTSKRQKSIRV